MKRRSMIKMLGAAGLLASPLMAHAGLSIVTRRAFYAVGPGWSAANRQVLNQLIADIGNSSVLYHSVRKPYAVFDWDNSCIMNDCQEALLMFQINQLAFKVSPDEFEQIIRQDIPDGVFAAEYKNAAGVLVRVEDLAADIAADYRWLYQHGLDSMIAPAVNGAADTSARETLEQLQKTEQFSDFRAKMRFMYDAICDSFPIESGYKWVLYFFKNFTRAELQQLTQESIEVNLGDALRKVKYVSSMTIPGRAGVVTASHFHGLRIHAEMASLMDTLRRNGFDVFVSTASLDDVVRVFAGLSRFGYNVAPEQVIGLRLEMDGERYVNRYRSGWHFNWGPGKTTGINNALVATKGYGPSLVLGDSDGDAWMLKDFSDTRLGVIINRLKTGPIGVLSKTAAQNIGQSRPRFVLQGRVERTGVFLPDEKTQKFGKTEWQLLAKSEQA